MIIIKTLSSSWWARYVQDKRDVWWVTTGSTPQIVRYQMKMTWNKRAVAVLRANHLRTSLSSSMTQNLFNKPHTGLVEQCRKEAEQASKALQHSKYASMTQKLCQSSAHICIHIHLLLCVCVYILPWLCKFVQAANRTLSLQDLASWSIRTISTGLVVVIVATELTAWWRSWLFCVA